MPYEFSGLYLFGPPLPFEDEVVLTHTTAQEAAVAREVAKLLQDEVAQIMEATPGTSRTEN